MDDMEVESQSDVGEVANSVQHSSGTKESEQEAPSIPWSVLPPLAVERIYSFLSREDQSSMSQVCKNWSEEYSSPNLWREITFNIPEQVLAADMHPAVRSAQRYGRYFQHVRVVRRQSRPAMLEVIQRQLNLFLQFLTEHSQLLSITFIGIWWHDDYEDFRRNLITLLMTQSKLLSVVFVKTFFKRNVAEEILQTVFSRSSRTLIKLELVYFMDTNSDIMPTETIIDAPLIFETLMNLKMLTIDYSLFENIITSIYEYGSGLRLREIGKLESIDLRCWIRWIRYNRIQPRAWKYFNEIFPALKMVYIDIRIGHQPADGFYTFLVRHMPVTHIYLEWKAYEYELGTVLRHLTDCEINRSLKFLHVCEVKKTDNLAQDLLNLLRAFPKLEDLHLALQSPANNLNSVFEYWLENGPLALKNVHIIIRNVSDRSLISNYTNLSEKYVPLLQVVGLNLIITLDND